MSVYVERARNGYGRMLMCHMIADTPAELHTMADRIGVARRWFQAPPKASFWHYDIAQTKRALAHVLADDGGFASRRKGDVMVTKQGVRDLNAPGHSNPPRRVRVLSRCPHVWEHATTFDCWLEIRINSERCGLCHAVR